MKTSWLLKSSTKSTLITIIMTVLISACSSENSAAAAHSKASQNGINHSAKTTEPVEPVEPVAPVPEPVAPAPEPVAPAPEPVAPEPVAPVSEPIAPAPEPVAPVSEPIAPAPEPVAPVSEPVAPAPETVAPVSEPVAMYSYNADLSNAQPLSSATLEQTTVYMFFSNTSQYSSMNFFCCKGIDGTSTGEAHNTPVRDSSAPFSYSVDFSQYTTTGTRELYVDATRTDGSGLDAIYANFSINITTIVTTPEPTVSDVSLSWVAPSAREDDNPISLSEISGYKIYYGTTQGNYNNSININDGTAESYTFTNFQAGTYYFVVTTKDTEGRESQFSSVVQIVI